jgi:hypothetical protein
MCILRGFLKGTYLRSVGRPNSTFAREWLINRGLAVEMTLRGRDDGASATTVLPAIGAWKPAKDAGFHIPTATATAAVKLRQTAKPPPIVHFYRFSLRTVFSLASLSLASFIREEATKEESDRAPTIRSVRPANHSSCPTNDSA